MKKILISLLVVGFTLLLGYYFYTNAPIQDPDNNQNNTNGEKNDISTSVILENTYNISKQYLAVRYETDNILINAKNYKDYESWNEETNKIIEKWNLLDKNASLLESKGKEFSQQTASFNFWEKASAYDSQEITNIFDKAPAGKKIATLAKHLGVDAKVANKILQNAQAQVEADAWNEAGDTFKKLETAATVIKDGCKVIGYIGGIAVSGGTAGLATASTLTKTAIIVGGADLTLEVTDDAAKIALGDKNKISKIVGTTRIVTEPVAGILSIYSLPENLASNFDKFNGIMIGLETFRGVAQEGKVVGVQLPVYQKPQEQKSVKVSILTDEEIEKWIEDIGLNDTQISVEEVNEILGTTPNTYEDGTENTNDPIISQDQPQQQIVNESDNHENQIQGGIIGNWHGQLRWKTAQDKDYQTKDLTITLKNDGTTESDVEGFSNSNWEQIGNQLTIVDGEDNGIKHYFELNGTKLTFLKTAGPDSEGVYGEILAGGEVFGGIYFTLTLEKK